jgi:hypothetical protein
MADKADDAASKAAEMAKGAADDMGDAAKDAMNKAESTAEDMKDEAGNMLGALQSQWREQLDGFDKRLTGLEESAARFDNAELNRYVQTIETKLGELKQAISSIAPGNVDMAQIKETVSGKMTELGGLFQAAEDKVKSLMAGGH